MTARPDLEAIKAEAEALNFNSGAVGRMSGLLDEVIVYALALEQDAAVLEQKAERLASYIMHWPACAFRADQYQPCNCGLREALGYHQ